MRRILLALLFCSLCAFAMPASASTVTVHVYSFGFSMNAKGGAVVDPVIYIGDTIHWVFDDNGHNTTSEAGQAESWKSSNTTNAKGTFFDYKFTKAGIFKYVCTPHRTTMKAKITVLDPALTISALTLNPTSVIGGTDSTGTVTLMGPAGNAGTVVKLSSSDTAVATVPASITVDSGKVTKTFTVTTKNVTADKTVKISAQIGTDVAVVAELKVTVDPALTIASFTVSPTSVKGGNSSTGTITLAGAAGANGTVVNLKSADTNVAIVPASVTVVKGKTVKTFTVTTKKVTADKIVKLSAQIGTAAAVDVNLTVTK